MSELIVTTQDCRKLGYCMASVRPWFAQHGLDWRSFALNGVPAARLLEIDDELARNAIKAAQARVEASRGE